MRLQFIKCILDHGNYQCNLDGTNYRCNLDHVNCLFKSKPYKPVDAI